jgi:tRNA dimethylallyltransferase
VKPPRIVALVGATATGKSALGEALAERMGGEVVCADSRQVFRELEIGTGKPAPSERAARAHHLFDALSLAAGPSHASAGWYASAASAACADIHARGRVAVLVGGSGLYLRAARQGLAATPPAAPAIRQRLSAEGRALGPEALHRRLAEVDPIVAARLGRRDAQRITRALEVWEASGKPLSWWHARPLEGAVAGEWHGIELVMPPDPLRVRIAARTAWMFENGLLEETRDLLVRGLAEPLRRLRAIGYDEAIECLGRRLTRAEAEARTSQRTAQLAKRQRTWFRNQWEGTRIEAEGMALPALIETTLRALG